MLRADLYSKSKPAPEGRIDLELMNLGTDSAEQVAYELTLNGIGNVALENIDLMFLLPDGVSYVPGSMRRRPGLRRSTRSRYRPVDGD